MASPRTAKLTGSPAWSDGSAFNGFVRIIVSVPNDGGGTAYPYIALDDQFPQVRIPRATVVPIVAGVFDQSTKLYYNAEIQPPGCRYVAYWYDVNRELIYPPGSPSLFDIAADPYSISIPTLTAPTTTVTAAAETDN